MNIPDAIAEFGHHIGLPALALDDAGLCRVVFDGTLAVDLEATPDGRALQVMALATPRDLPSCSTEMLEAMLGANLLGVSTGGAHFSLSRADGHVFFERRLDMASLDFNGFAMEMESFVNHLEGWQMKLAAMPG